MPIVAPRSPGGLLRRRPGGRPDRHDLPRRRCSCSPTATSPTAPSRGGSPTSTTCPTCGVEFATEPNHDAGRDGTEVFWPYKRDPETLARPWAVPGTAGPRAPHRRHREGRRHRQHLLRPGQPRPHGPHPPGQGRRHRRDDPAAGGRRPDRRRAACWCWAGARPTARSPRPAGWSAPTGVEVAQAHLRHLNPFPANLGEVLRALRQGPDPGDEPRVSSRQLDAGPRQVPRRRASATTRSAACRSRPRSWPT